MEIKIGVLHSSREVVVDSEQDAAEIESAVSDALSTGSPLRLVDSKGSVILVPAAVLSYVEIGTPRKGGVGFGQL